MVVLWFIYLSVEVEQHARRSFGPSEGLEFFLARSSLWKNKLLELFGIQVDSVECAEGQHRPVVCLLPELMEKAHFEISEILLSRLFHFSQPVSIMGGCNLYGTLCSTDTPTLPNISSIALFLMLLE